MATEASNEIAIKVLEERVKSWMETTTEYRKSLCHKLDDINIKLNDLPCKERSSFYKSVTKQLNFIWIVLALFIGTSITAIVTATSVAKDMQVITQK